MKTKEDVEEVESVKEVMGGNAEWQRPIDTSSHLFKHLEPRQCLV